MSEAVPDPFPNLGFQYDRNRYIEQPRKFRVACIGAGFSGVYMGIRMQMTSPDVELVIYEKNSKIGGTWYENTYPGAACDIPSHRYAYTFELKPDWTHFYSHSSEIQKYIEDTAVKYKADQFIKFEHKLVDARWDEDAGKWHLKIEHGGKIVEDTVDILVNACGPLNNWKWPDIPNRESYKGDILHSAAWDGSVGFKGKNIAVIGSGSSSIQIVPSLQPVVSHLDTYIRSSTYIAPAFSEDMLPRHPDGSLDTRYSEKQLEEFKDPDALIAHRQALEGGISQGFHAFFKHTELQKTFRKSVEESMVKRLAKKPELAKFLIPTWELGCRRLTPGIGYLEALCEDNVAVISTGIKSFTPDGLELADGTKKTYDSVICATGFDVSHKPRFTLIGRNGHQLDEAFAANPYGYLALAMKQMPNYFTINGPNAPIGQGSLVPASEQQVEYICKAINKIRRQDIKSICIKDKAIEEFTRFTDSWMQDSVWSGKCRSWYKNGKVDGRVTALWPGSGLHFIEALEDPRWEDYDYTYLNDVCRYSYYGNGLVKVEVEGGNRNIQVLSRIGMMRVHPALTDKQREEQEKVYQAAQRALKRALEEAPAKA